jgi:putative ATP-dependent endonuclease of the OLD family
VANSDIKKLIHIKKDEGYTVLQNLNNFNEIINDLGINVKNQFVKVFEKAKMLLLLEGPDDVKAFNHVAEVYKNNKLIEYTFRDMGILLVPIGGCDSIQHWMTLELLKDLSKPFFVIQDSDKDNEHAVSQRREALIKLGLIEYKDFIVLRKRSLENYINKKVFERSIPGIEIQFDDYTHMKNLCKNHPQSGRLGGKNVAEKFFTQQTFEDLRESFSYNGGDEFLDIYNLIVERITDSN